ncbi:hypothetical protein CEV34_0174 [Brucella pseudogrignonensis]|uniref:Uncharacterized protein n=1 Tax=Brucella pseudogrignonensis TaxID=419475 RepID=A0A256GU82_9HYPH|nr:hypothetical protein CEV34_0174 [Brucella pseudogrignonensis]
MSEPRGTAAGRRGRGRIRVYSARLIVFYRQSGLSTRTLSILAGVHVA